MTSRSLALILVSLAFSIVTPETTDAQPSTGEFAFVSDTQAPMDVEKIFLKANQNERATGLVFHDILKERPAALFILGDVVSLGYQERNWVTMDLYLDSCRKAGIRVSALMGNHDVMTKAKRGEQRFQVRFPDHDRTGFYQVIDSVAVVFLNSNFTKLSRKDFEKQQVWYRSTLRMLDGDPAVLAILVTCHHAPYSNSQVVGSSRKVQQNFVPDYIQSRKARIFITGHSHNYEHFILERKDFLVIGGGGGLSQPLTTSKERLDDISAGYKPAYHYLLVRRGHGSLTMTSRFLAADFSHFSRGLSFTLKL